MEFYFSGVASSAEFAMLWAAGLPRPLVDQVDLSNIGDWEGDRLSVVNARNMERYLMSGCRRAAAA